MAVIGKSSLKGGIGEPRAGLYQLAHAIEQPHGAKARGARPERGAKLARERPAVEPGRALQFANGAAIRRTFGDQGTDAQQALGVRQSLRFVSGAITGTVAVLLAVAAGVMALLSSVPGLGASLTFGSTAYILYLAWKIATAPPLAKQTADAGAPSFVAGFLLAIANPKAWFAIAAVFMGSTLTQLSGLWDASLKASVLAAMIVVIHFTWLMGGASLAGVLGDPRRSRIANRVFALLLVATTVRALIGWNQAV
jgi:threonine/homoserine/homoserine lactone efflux protein